MISSSISQIKQKARSSLPSKVKNTDESTISNKENIGFEQNIDQNLNSIKQTITMLKEYEKLCIEKEDYLMAEETKNKIEFLQRQEKVIDKERGVLKGQQTVQTICKEGEEEIQQFQAYWDGMIQALIQELKMVESKLIKQHEDEMAEFKQKMSEEEPQKVKYTPKVLELRKNLTSLIKVRKYKEAGEVKTKLRSLEADCEELWGFKHLQKQKVLLQKLEKKQAHELKAMRVRLEGVFNEKIKERDQKFEILLKRNRKRRVESSKSKAKYSQSQSRASQFNSRSRSQSRVLTESKVTVNGSKY